MATTTELPVMDAGLYNAELPQWLSLSSDGNTNFGGHSQLHGSSVEQGMKCAKSSENETWKINTSE